MFPVIKAEWNRMMHTTTSMKRRTPASSSSGSARTYLAFAVASMLVCNHIEAQIQQTYDVNRVWTSDQPSKATESLQLQKAVYLPYESQVIQSNLNTQPSYSDQRQSTSWPSYGANRLSTTRQPQPPQTWQPATTNQYDYFPGRNDSPQFKPQTSNIVHNHVQRNTPITNQPATAYSTQRAVQQQNSYNLNSMQQPLRGSEQDQGFTNGAAAEPQASYSQAPAITDNSQRVYSDPSPYGLPGSIYPPLAPAPYPASVQPLANPTFTGLLASAVQPSTQIIPPQTTAIQFDMKNINKGLLSSIISGNERFAMKMLKEIVNQDLDHDHFFSPFSIWSLLATIAAGAEGRTLLELKNIINVDNIPALTEAYDHIFNELVETGRKTDTIDLTVFQGLFFNQSQPVGVEFQRIINDSYHVQSFPFDSTKPQLAISDINNQILSLTNGALRSTLQAEDLRSASLLMLSLINFRGQWASPFNRTFTKRETFYDEFSQPTGTAQMMFQRTVVPYAPIVELQSHAIELPYGEKNRLSMLVILPRKNVPLSEVVNSLQSFSVAKILEKLRKALEDFEDDEIEVFLPKFQTSTDTVLNEVLQRLGLHEVFTTEAHLNKIHRNIYLSKMVHQANIQVDEEGTAASAITSGVFANKSSAPRFYANRPFLYLIVDKMSGLVLFCGQMRNNPSSK